MVTVLFLNFGINFITVVTFMAAQGATLQCAYMPRANLEGASLKNCNFDAAYGSKVNLEGCEEFM